MFYEFRVRFRSEYFLTYHFATFPQALGLRGRLEPAIRRCHGGEITGTRSLVESRETTFKCWLYRIWGYLIIKYARKQQLDLWFSVFEVATGWGIHNEMLRKNRRQPWRSNVFNENFQLCRWFVKLFTVPNNEAVNRLLFPLKHQRCISCLLLRYYVSSYPSNFCHLRLFKPYSNFDNESFRICFSSFLKEVQEIIFWGLSLLNTFVEKIQSIHELSRIDFLSKTHSGSLNLDMLVIYFHSVP